MDSTPKRRRFQFSLKSLWVLMTVLCGILGAFWHFVIAPAERQRGAAQMVEGLGGAIRRGSPYEEYWVVDQLREVLPRDYIDVAGGVSLDSSPARDQDIARLKVLSQLSSVYLRGTRLTDASAPNLRSLRELVILDVSETELTDAGLLELCDLPKLVSLFLDDTEVTDAGLSHLPYQSTLRNLSLRNTPVTNAGLIHLSRLSGLKSLDITGTQVTSEGVATFQQSLPNCLIVGAPRAP
ncbi:MAG: leucine-rich repeat domain-containing protein [Pirellulaceae bacterium]